MDTALKSCTGNGTIELRYGTATKSSTMEKRESAGALQQRIQPKRDIPNIVSWLGYSK
jgi:hypothetical protein